jgi:polyribonucleotide nucleotidyltransferase
VIGPHGRTISEIQSLSGCHIQFNKVQEGQQVAERIVTITGPSQAHTNRAIELISAKVDEWRRNSGLGYAAQSHVHPGAVQAVLHANQGVQHHYAPQQPPSFPNPTGY